ncbi:hypothetical protein DL764_006403 [Monosporascus ibericus]|uniref:Uncharacterized protein n=1 Tax=Monosporascus ibericus TaxID=155417 RepID=A0A4Q4T8A6_9PEZI|nr:hypothetical protein DL764_006403 [Monosporascus ibericus]
MSGNNTPIVTLQERPNNAESNGRRDIRRRTGRSKELGERSQMTRGEQVWQIIRARNRHDSELRSEGEAKRGDFRRKTRSATKREEKEKEIQTSRPAVPVAADMGDIEERKPWETLVIGDLGEGLSYIGEKDREILQQRYIIKHHEKNSPGQADHHKRLLDELIRERCEMEDDEENYVPADQRDARKSVMERVETLHWALDTCKCEAEEVNIRAALEGYASGYIEYPSNFTLIYSGHIVDTCPTYQSFCADRSERIERYADKHGAGWLWIEPPLAGSGFELLAKKGLCLDRKPLKTYGIGHYAICLNFEVDKNKVMSEGKKPYQKTKKTAGVVTGHSDAKAWAQFETLLDSGATVPILHKEDLRHFGIVMECYAAQGVSETRTATSTISLRFYEMYVSICTKDGQSIVGQGNPATWPSEPPILGGFVPVSISTTQLAGRRPLYDDRMSGMLPFDAAYMSSAPTMGKIWLGEDRRDILGAGRFPGHLRYDAEKALRPEYPPKLDDVRHGMETPDVVFFAHHLRDSPGTQFIDTDPPEESAEIKPPPPEKMPKGSTAKWRETKILSESEIRDQNTAKRKSPHTSEAETRGQYSPHLLRP